MPKRVALLTDFISHDSAYSLCTVVANQVKMLVRGGYKPKLLVRQGFPEKDEVYYNGAEIEVLDPGKVGSNVVKITPESDEEILHLKNQIERSLENVDLVCSHDLIFQPNLWPYLIACRRVARERPDLQWLHWVHSATNLDVRNQLGHFKAELMGPFPNSRLVVMHAEELWRKANLYGYELNQCVIIPNPIDLTEDYHIFTKYVIEQTGLVMADMIAVYPCRLDRGKQPEVIIEIFGELVSMGIDARVVIIDFHSTSKDKTDDKMVYRKELKALAKERKVTVIFMSDFGIAGAPYHIPHKAVMDFMDYADILIHPSRSESDPLILPEAMWKRCALFLNFDLPVFRQYQGRAMFGQFSSGISVTDGNVGETKTEYGDRRAYMHDMAGRVAYLMQTNDLLYLHAKMRRERSLEAVWGKNLWPAIEAR